MDETLVMVGKHSRVFTDIAGIVSRPWQLYNALLNASSMGVMDKLLFGSGFPHHTPAAAIEALYSINTYSHGTAMPSIPRSQLRSIVERDSLLCLGIEAEIAHRHRPDDDGVNTEFEKISVTNRPVPVVRPSLGARLR